MTQNRQQDIIEAFGYKMGTFTGYWSVRLRPKRVNRKFLMELATQLEASPDELLEAWFCMRKLQVSRSSSRMIVTLDRPAYNGKNPFSSDLTPQERAEADEWQRKNDLQSGYLNTVYFFIPDEQRYMVSPY